MSVFVLVKGKNFGETYPLTSNGRAFLNEKTGEKYLQEEGFLLTPQAYGASLWISVEKNEWAKLVEIKVDTDIK